MNTLMKTGASRSARSWLLGLLFAMLAAMSFAAVIFSTDQRGRVAGLAAPATVDSLPVDPSGGSIVLFVFARSDGGLPLARRIRVFSGRPRGNTRPMPLRVFRDIARDVAPTF